MPSSLASDRVDGKALTSTQTAVKDRVAKALIDLVIVRSARTSIERDVQGSD